MFPRRTNATQHTQIWLPVLYPTKMDCITIGIYDSDYLSTDQIVAQLRPFEYSALQKRPEIYAPHWVSPCREEHDGRTRRHQHDTTQHQSACLYAARVRRRNRRPRRTEWHRRPRLTRDASAAPSLSLFFVSRSLSLPR